MHFPKVVKWRWEIEKPIFHLHGYKDVQNQVFEKLFEFNQYIVFLLYLEIVYNWFLLIYILYWSNSKNQKKKGVGKLCEVGMMVSFKWKSCRLINLKVNLELIILRYILDDTICNTMKRITILWRRSFIKMEMFIDIFFFVIYKTNLDYLSCFIQFINLEAYSRLIVAHFIYWKRVKAYFARFNVR